MWEKKLLDQNYSAKICTQLDGLRVSCNAILGKTALPVFQIGKDERRNVSIQLISWDSYLACVGREGKESFECSACLT